MQAKRDSDYKSYFNLDEQVAAAAPAIDAEALHVSETEEVSSSHYEIKCTELTHSKQEYPLRFILAGCSILFILSQPASTSVIHSPFPAP